jgi:hypothetical protein
VADDVVRWLGSTAILKLSEQLPHTTVDAHSSTRPILGRYRRMIGKRTGNGVGAFGIHVLFLG